MENKIRQTYNVAEPKLSRFGRVISKSSQQSLSRQR